MAHGSDAVVSCRLFQTIGTASALYRHFTGIAVVGSSPPHECPSTHRNGMDESVTCNVGYRVDLPNICVTWPTAFMRLSSSKGLDRCAAKPASRLRATSSS
jgi:hypothetical protein